MPSWVERNNGLLKKWWQPATVADGDIVAIYQAIGAGSLADSYVNLANPGTNDAVPGIAPTWARNTGWVFASSEHLTTGITPTSSYTILVHCEAVGATTGTDSIIGQQATNASQYMTAGLSVVGGNIAGTLNWVWSTANFGGGISPGTPTFRWSQTLASNKAYQNGTLVTTLSAVFSGTPVAVYIGARNNGGVATDPFTGRILAAAIYNRELTATEVLSISNQAHSLTEFDDPTPNVNYIVIHPRTRHLASANHELLIATDSGIFHTENGGRQWGKIELPDPSNAEFGDAPAATVDELVFDWIDYAQLEPNNPTGPMAIYCRGLKTSLSRIWIYKSEDDGETWTSRGVVAT